VKKNKTLFAVSLVVLILGLVWLTSVSDSSIENSEDTAADDLLRENRQQMAMFYQTPRQALTMKADLGSEECRQFWSAIRELDLRVQQDEFPDIKQATNSEKCTQVPASLKSLHDHFNKVCGKSTDSQQCLVALYYYRAALTDLMTKDIPLGQINDPKIVIDKMLANREINPVFSIQAAERLAELEPKLYEAKKAQVLGRLYLSSRNKEGSSEADWQALDKAISQAREMSETDPELIEAELLSELFRASDGKLAEEKARALFPVGSVYINASNSTNPSTLLGFGTWVAFGSGRVLVGFNAADPLFDTAEETGGSKDAIVVSHTHTGSTASAGTHSHSIQAVGVITESGSSGLIRFNDNDAIGYSTASAGAHTHDVTINSTGSSGTNANLQPYITVYMWKRTA
jgi:hypothetical protein